MFTIVMMILSSLVTLYLARPAFRKRVHDFIDWADKDDGPTLGDPTDDPVSKDYVSAWSSDERRAEGGPAKDWMEWTDEDEQNLPQSK